MQLRITPPTDCRYWAALLVASMCGANLGDVFPDLLHFQAPPSLAILLALFLSVLTLEAMARRGGEFYYWLVLLIVRAAATSIADFAIASAHLGYLVTAGMAAVALALLIAFRKRSTPLAPSGRMRADGLFWLTMLVAGTLGTLIGDGFGHAFGSVVFSVPISATIATVALMIVLASWLTFSFRSTIAFWCAIVVVRWWGTNVGDILAFVVGLSTSLTVTAVALAGMLAVWRQSKAPARAER